MASSIVQCSECVYWVQEEGTEVGLCRRNAPRPALPMGTEMAQWMRTNAADGCGEGKKEVGPSGKVEGSDA